MKQRKKITIRMPRPNPRQEMAFRSKKRNTIFGGARGGGKSWFLRWKAVLMSVKYKGITTLIIRKTYPELEKNHIKPLKAMTKDVAKYNENKKCMTFFNGSTINFQYCAMDKDLEKIQGQEYDVIFIDEATQLTEFQIKSIGACIRGVNDFPKRMYMTCNPGGKGHQYIKRLKDGRFLPEENPEDYVFIQSLVTDNTALMKADPEYIKWLEALPPKLKEGWLYGNWDIYEGQFFEEFRDNPEGYETRKMTHVIPPMQEIPRGWKIFRSYDWGYNHPFSCGWWAMDFDGVIYRILELYGCKKDEPNAGVKWTDEKQFAEIARIEREHPYLKGRKIYGVADPSIWSAEKTGLSTADTAAKHGIHFQKANNDRIAGWMQCRYRMAFDENGYPMMYVFKNCEAFIRTVPLLVYDDNRPEDLNSDDEDHIADEWRYFCMMNPIKPTVNKQENIPMIDPLDQYKRAKERGQSWTR